MRRAGKSFYEIAESVGLNTVSVCYWGQLVLPEDLQQDRLGRPGRGIRWLEVLPPEEFRRLRKQGLSYSQVASLKGISEAAVNQYARVVLPADLRRRRSTCRRVKQRAQCKRCSMLEEPGNVLEAVEVEIEGKAVTQQWCALCRLEAQGVNLLDFFESGAALEYEVETGEGVWIV